VIKNEDRATISWTFIRPEALSKEEFESQLLNFEMECKDGRRRYRARIIFFNEIDFALF
jgi:hypothetical protein